MIWIITMGAHFNHHFALDFLYDPPIGPVVAAPVVAAVQAVESTEVASRRLSLVASL